MPRLRPLLHQMRRRSAAWALAAVAGSLGLLGTPTQAQVGRPQLSEAQAAAHSRQAVLAAAGPLEALVRDGWDPLRDAVITGPSPAPDAALWHYWVDPRTPTGHSTPQAKGTRRFGTVQAALRQAHLDTLAGVHAQHTRLYIAVLPGTYRELVVVPPTPLPITLWGLGATPTDVRIEAGLHARMPGATLARLHGPVFAAPEQHPQISAPVLGCAARAEIGTGCTATLRVRNAGFQLRGITVANTFGQDQPGAHQQAVALLSDGADRVHLEQVRLLGHQDTLYLKNPSPTTVARVAVHRSHIAGDVDFIFGDATAWFGHSEIHFTGQRPGGHAVGAGYIAAPSTHWRAPYGFVFEHSRFTSDGQGLAGRGGVHLARQWFVGARCSPFGQATDTQPNGPRCVPEPALPPLPATAASEAGADPRLAPHQRLLARSSLEAVGRMVVLHSQLGPHLQRDEPWAPWSAQPTHAAYRPALPDSDSFWRLLQAAGHQPAHWGWQQPQPAQAWLAEYRNTVLAGTPEGQRQ